MVISVSAQMHSAQTAPAPVVGQTAVIGNLLAPLQTSAVMEIPGLGSSALPLSASMPGSEAPIAPKTLRLVVAPVVEPNKRFRLLDSKAVEKIVEESAGKARILSARGAGSLFDTEAFIEADAAQAAELSAKFEAAGMQAVRLDEMLSRMNAALSGSAPMTEEEVHALAALMDNGGLLQQAEAFGRVLSAAKSSSGLSEEARKDAALALYSGVGPIINAFNAVRGDQNTRLREGLEPVSWIDAPAVVKQEHAIVRELAEPQFMDQVQPIRVLVAAAAEAILALKAPYAASFVNAMLVHAEYAAAEMIAKSPERTAEFIEGWLAHLSAGVAETASLAGSPARPHGVSHGGGNQNVLAHRESVAYYDQETRRPFLPQDERHVAAILLGMSASAAQEWTDRFVALLISADEAIPGIDRAERTRYLKEAEGQFEAVAGPLPADPAQAQKYSGWKSDYMEEALARYEKWNKIEGIEASDRSLLFMYFEPYMDFAPGFDANLYISGVAGALKAALERVSGAATLKAVVDAAVGFVHDARLWASPEVLSAQQQTLDGLDASAKAVAVRLGLSLR